MAKAETSEIAGELKKLLMAKRLVLGAEATIKALRKGGVQKVFIASNCSTLVRSDVETLCKVSGAECVSLAQGTDEIGVMCKKPFAISVIGVI